jgi:hypothetical protein
MVCDAGGSTVDISTYELKEMNAKRMNLTELELPGCELILVFVIRNR